MSEKMAEAGSVDDDTMTKAEFERATNDLMEHMIPIVVNEAYSDCKKRAREIVFNAIGATLMLYAAATLLLSDVHFSFFMLGLVFLAGGCYLAHRVYDELTSPWHLESVKVTATIVDKGETV